METKTKVKASKADSKVKTKKSKKQEVIEKVTPINKNKLIESVISNREVKYIYPDDVIDTLSRKSWRQKVRIKLNKLERDMLRIKDQTSKEYSRAKKAYERYAKEVTKVEGAA